MKWYYFSFFIILFISCSDKKRVPSELIQPAKMQAILMDILIIDAVNSVKQGADQSLNITDLNSKSIATVLKNYQISDAAFKKSYSYYLAHPDILKPIADSISAIAARQVINSYSDTLNTHSNDTNIPDVKCRIRHRF
ncbi:MAG: DUF4296 domain-containing protein [Chitinophagaceae bacterium]|jgi:hypothetical protein